MKGFLTTLLIVVMLTPSLACAMPSCATYETAKAASHPCAGHESHHGEQKQSKTGKINLLQDCAGIDLQVADNPVSFKKPELKEASFFTSPDFSIAQNWLPARAHEIRGPPPDWPKITQAQFPIFLTTLRLRI